MKLATRNNGTRDGQLVVVSRDLQWMEAATGIAATLQEAIERWDETQPLLLSRYRALNAGETARAIPLTPDGLLAPLPRAWQWLDGSAFLTHGERMQQAFNLPPIEGVKHTPLMYQGCGDDFLGSQQDILCADEAWGLDFEGEFAVLVDDVPMGCEAGEALAHVRLLLQLNDVSLRALAPREMKTGFGFIHAKPSSAFAPVAVTPDELGDAWHAGRVDLPLTIRRNGEPFGNQPGIGMHFHFGELIAHAALTRRLRAGTLIGSGTVSGQDPAKGASCIAEVRALETLAYGAPRTPFLRPGDKVFMESRTRDGEVLFGAIKQRVVIATDKDNRL
ncbi:MULTISPECIES: fumarylacetoacetate hydrolase family protein [unclassified Leclercia]|uniref:Fumarylacetoacetate hydrolase family protein n=1 Tax=Leclercia barmai TaxID=2785629 RepID=A0ABS7RYY9_9ENTR|nr:MULTISPECIES: fumarylacetoacetate hydrolase family protein [unclassified Leclercia]MBZ0059505.1 fumarylacetoacetate hydrolase family protein [Leclercia sp. EMC7]MCM5697363.1 fumarylacetoacetate hydrolase family protein [Leclercia sp. LTM01]MCM5702043.1 fumarylacetoacetate hydrolase family protein [Leclercia sp. LTM14]